MFEFPLGVWLWLALAAPPVADSPEAHRLVVVLGHDDYVVRERADAALRKLGIKALPAVRAARNHADVEIRYRARRILEELVEHEVNRRGEMPWLDSLWLYPGSGITYATPSDITPEGARCRQYRGYLEAEGWPDGEGWPRHRRATKAMVRQWIRDGVPDVVIDGVLAHMRANDAKWKKANNWPKVEELPPPKDLPPGD
jgi:hypothetical protein